MCSFISVKKKLQQNTLAHPKTNQKNEMKLITRNQLENILKLASERIFEI